MGPSIQYLGYIRSLNCLCTAWTILLNLYEDASVNSNPSPSSVPFLQRPATPQHGVIALAKACVEKTFGVLLEGCCAQWERATCHWWVALMLHPCQFSDLGSNPVIFSAQKWLWGWLAASCAAERGVFFKVPCEELGNLIALLAGQPWLLQHLGGLFYPSPHQRYNPSLVYKEGWYAWMKRVLPGKQGKILTLAPQKLLGVGLHFFFQFHPAFQEVATNPLLLPIKPLRLFPTSRLCLRSTCFVSIRQTGCWRYCSWKGSTCFISSVNHLRLEPGSGGWEVSTCMVLPFPGSHPGGTKLFCLGGSFNSRWITSLLNTLEADIFCSVFRHPSAWMTDSTFLLEMCMWFLLILLSKVAERFRVYQALVICHSSPPPPLSFMTPVLLPDKGIYL